MSWLRRSRPVLDDPERLSAITRSGVLALHATRLQTLTVRAVRLLHADAAQVNVVDDQQQHHVAACPPVLERTGPVKESGCRLVVETGQLLVVPDAERHPIVCDMPWAAVWRGYLGHPITYDGQVIGSFCVLTEEPRAWTLTDSHTLAELAAQASRTLAA